MNKVPVVEPVAVKVTDPLGVVEVAEVSVTVAAQVVRLPNGSVDGEQVTLVVVE